MDVWHPVIELTGEDSCEDAENYKDVNGDDTRVVVVEVEDGSEDYTAQLERKFSDGAGGYNEIGEESNPGEDFSNPMMEAAKDMGDGVRLVFDYTNDRFVLEEWVEPE